MYLIKVVVNSGSESYGSIDTAWKDCLQLAWLFCCFLVLCYCGSSFMSSSSNIDLVLSHCMLKRVLSYVCTAMFVSRVCKTCCAGEGERCPAAGSAPGSWCWSMQHSTVYVWIACLWHGLGMAAFVLTWTGSRHASVKVGAKSWLYWNSVKVRLAPNPILAVVNSSLWKSTVILVQDAILQLTDLLYLACIVS